MSSCPGSTLLTAPSTYSLEISIRYRTVRIVIQSTLAITDGQNTASSVRYRYSKGSGIENGASPQAGVDQSRGSREPNFAPEWEYFESL